MLFMNLIFFGVALVCMAITGSIAKATVGALLRPAGMLNRGFCAIFGGIATVTMGSATALFMFLAVL